MSERKNKGTTIYVPYELKERIDSLAKRYNKDRWKIVLEALSLYETSIRRARTKEELPIVDKVIWYVEKLAMSIGILKASPTKENLMKTMKTIAQVKERLQVNTTILEKAVEDYVNAMSVQIDDLARRHDVIDEVTIELNMALKSVLIEIVYRWILKEETKGEAPTTEPQGAQA
jgi:predicted transcriptional regulator